MKRNTKPFAASIVLFLCVVTCFTFSDIATATHATKPSRSDSATLRPRGPSLTIICRGLLAFRRDQKQQSLEAGVLPAPEHEFTLKLLEQSPQGVSTLEIPLNRLLDPRGDNLVIEFPAGRKGVSYYQNGVFDRRQGLGDVRDFRWLIDLEGKEFYDRNLASDLKTLGTVVKFGNGEFYTRTTTVPLFRRIGEKKFEYFGRAAQEIATDVFLENGDLIITSQKSGAEFFRLQQKPDTTYELVFENAPARNMAMSVNHFQYYYRLFPLSKSDWYEFKVATSKSVNNSFASGSLNFVHFAHSPLTDEAPCMGAGYGGGGSLPPFPPG